MEQANERLEQQSITTPFLPTDKIPSRVVNSAGKYIGDVTALPTGSILGLGSGTPGARKTNLENIQLAECIGNVRAMLIGIFCDDIFKDIATDEGEFGYGSSDVHDS